MTRGEMLLRRDGGIARLMREIATAAREFDRLLKHGEWIVERGPDGMPARMYWFSPHEIRRAMERKEA